jgi:hypothetical protein
MSKILVPAALALALGVTFAPVHARAAGCVKGAVVGGVAGHVAGHHGVLGAAAGCAIGHHEAAKHESEARQQAVDNNRTPDSSTNSSNH